MSKTYRVLAINPGSTSTKIAVFDDEKEIFTKTLTHTKEDLAGYAKVADQFGFRRDLITEALAEAHIDPKTLSAVIGRGGLVRPITSGIYEVDEHLKQDLIAGVMGEHASNLGGLIAADITSSLDGVKAYIADPVVVDELDEVARVAGHPLFQRLSIFHALNQKAVARAYAKTEHKAYEEMNIVVAHMGGGISVGAHCKGRVVDVNNALDGEGPFSPERSGTLPAGQLVDLCFSGKYTHEEVSGMLCGKGGVSAHLGTTNIAEVYQRSVEGDEKAGLIIRAMAYNVAKSVGAMATVLEGEVDAVILTGGIARSEFICNYIRERVGFIAPVVVIPGEDEMAALVTNALMVLRGEISPCRYNG